MASAAVRVTAPHPDLFGELQRQDTSCRRPKGRKSHSRTPARLSLAVSHMKTASYT